MASQAVDIEALRTEVEKLRVEASSHAEATAVMSKLREDAVCEKAVLSEELAAARVSTEAASSDAEAANNALQSKLSELNELQDRLSSLTSESSMKYASEMASTRAELEEKVGMNNKMVFACSKR